MYYYDYDDYDEKIRRMEEENDNAIRQCQNEIRRLRAVIRNDFEQRELFREALERELANDRANKPGIERALKLMDEFYG